MPKCQSQQMGTARKRACQLTTTVSRMAVPVMPPRTEAGAVTVTKGVKPRLRTRPPLYYG